MIARTRRGRVRTERVDEYVDVLERTAMAEYRRTAGNQGAQVLTRDLGDGSTEVVTLSWWNDLDVVRALAGEEVERARCHPQDGEFLLERDETVRHCEQRAPAAVRSETETLLACLGHLRREAVRTLRDLDEERDRSFDPPEGTSTAEVVARYRRVCERSDEIVRASHPEALSAVADPGEDGPDPLRSVLVHLVEGTAWHAGQADVLRESLDGVTND